MDKRQNYMDGIRLYSDVLEGHANPPKKQVEYYKKVEKTTSTTVVKDGKKPSQQREVSTTIIKNGNNPEQVSKKMISSKNYGNSSHEERSRRFGEWGKNNNSGIEKSYQVSRRFETSNKKEYTGLQPSFQAVNSSNKYNSITSSKGYKKYVASSTSRKNNYSSSTGKVPLSLKYGADVKVNQTYTSENKEKYAFQGTVKEKDNYTYYVSGIGYVDKNGIPLDKSKIPLMERSKTVPKPIVRHERLVIRIQIKRKERTGEPEENYEYRESKLVQRRPSYVIHRQGDPYYQLIDRKRYSSLTTRPKGYLYDLNSSLEDFKYDDYMKGKTNISKGYSNYTFRSNLDEKAGKVYDTAKSVKPYKSSSVNKYQNNYNTHTVSSAKESQSFGNYKSYNNKYDSSYQRTLNADENRRNFGTKGIYEKSFTEGNRGGIGSKFNNLNNAGRSSSYVSGESRRQQIITSTKDKKKNVPPSYKKFEEKSYESYNSGKKQYGQNMQNINRKIFETEKYKRGGDGSKQYQETTEEKYSKEVISGNYPQGVYDANKNQKKTYELNNKASSLDKYKRGGNASTSYQIRTESTYQKDSLNKRDSESSAYQKKPDSTQKDSIQNQNYKRGEGHAQSSYQRREETSYRKDSTSPNAYQKKTETTYQKEIYSSNYQKDGNVPNTYQKKNRNFLPKKY